MAAETGTATDYRDLLQKLKLFLTGESVSPVGSNGLNWTVEEERSKFTSPQTDIAFGDVANGAHEQTAGNHDQSHDQLIFRSTGGASPENPCYFVVQTYGFSPTGYFNWQVRALTGYATTSPGYVTIPNQPGVSPPCFLLLQNTTMTYWFMATNRHVKGVIKTGSSYQPFYFGFMNAFSTNSDYPYPMVVAATSGVENNIFSSTAITTAFAGFNGGGDNNDDLSNTVTGFPTQGYGAGYCRFVDGQWYTVKNFQGSSTEGYLTGGGTGQVQVWPWNFLNDNQIEDSEAHEDNIAFNQAYRVATPGGTAVFQLAQAFASPPLTTLWPVTLLIPTGSTLLGELDGIYWAPGGGGLTSEDEIIDSGESPEVTNIVFQNVWRTDAWTYMAMRFE